MATVDQYDWQSLLNQTQDLVQQVCVLARWLFVFLRAPAQSARAQSEVALLARVRPSAYTPHRTRTPHTPNKQDYHGYPVVQRDLPGLLQATQQVRSRTSRVRTLAEQTAATKLLAHQGFDATR
jgi:hypothetical protein